MKSLSLLTPAKINLCLSVLGRRSDGYHDVEMLMQMVGLYDEVQVSLSGQGIQLACDQPSLPAGDSNIAVRAAAAALAKSGKRTGIAIELKKNIPVAAGLGGGSSDAAAVLIACNVLLELGLDGQGLAGIGAGLGMDVPFFFSGPTALARGRGEMLTPLPPPDPFWVLLVNPGFETSTAWAYQNLNLGLTKKGDCTTIAGLRIGSIAASLHNDLETVTAAAHPAIAEMREALLDAGALGARMSGSGPTVFGIFDKESACRTAADRLAGRGWLLFPAPSLTGSPFAGHL